MPARNALVLDASVTLSWCFEDEVHACSDAVLEHLKSGEALVSMIWPLEVGNALPVAERKERLSKADTTRAIELQCRYWTHLIADVITSKLDVRDTVAMLPEMSSSFNEEIGFGERLISNNPVGADIGH